MFIKKHCVHKKITVFTLLNLTLIWQIEKLMIVTQEPPCFYRFWSPAFFLRSFYAKSPIERCYKSSLYQPHGYIHDQHYHNTQPKELAVKKTNILSRPFATIIDYVAGEIFWGIISVTLFFSQFISVNSPRDDPPSTTRTFYNDNKKLLTRNRQKAAHGI